MVTRQRACVLALLAAMSTACVGPATTTDAYRGKVVHASDAALSEVRTVTLAARSLVDGRLFTAYADVLISDAEESLSSVQGQFDSIQPPDDHVSDELRDALDTLLSAGLGEVSTLRIALRRDHVEGLP